MGAAPTKEPGDTYRLLLVGITGSGKSSTGNSILGKPAFQAKSCMSTVTKECSLQYATRDNITFEVMDTPGFRDYGRLSDEISGTISKFLAGVSPGPHAVLLVMSATTRFTDDVDTAYTEAKKLLGEHDLVSRIVLIFTGGDILKNENANVNVAIKSQIDNSVASLKRIVSDADERYVVFDNKATGRAQRRQLAKLLEYVRKVCGSDFTYLSNPAQEHINALIATEASRVAKSNDLPPEYATLKVRQAMVNATMEDPLLREAANRIRQEIDARKVNINTGRCALM